jgi:hypothetical protein
MGEKGKRWSQSAPPVIMLGLGPSPQRGVEMEFLMLRYGLITGGVLLLMATSYGQVGTTFDDSPRLIRDALRNGNTSGSIVYSDKCEFVGPRIPAPPLVHPARKTGDTVEVLREMFSGHSGMDVRRDANGIIRVMENGTPTDILNVKIHHISFDPSHVLFPKLFHGPNMALLAILSSPEVRSFEEQQHIVPTDFKLEGTMGQDLPALSGELSDVTLLEALDYVLKTFPGYWVYESCDSSDGRRTVHFRFYY